MTPRPAIQNVGDLFSGDTVLPGQAPVTSPPFGVSPPNRNNLFGCELCAMVASLLEEVRAAVQECVVSTAFAYNKVAARVVCLVSVDMVDFGPWRERAAERLRCYMNVLRDVALRVGISVTAVQDSPVSAAVLCKDATRPVVMIGTAGKVAPHPRTLNRTELCTALPNPIWPCPKSLSALTTFSVDHKDKSSGPR